MTHRHIIVSIKTFLANERVVAPLYGDVSNFDLTGYDPSNPAAIADLNPDTQQILAALQNNDFVGYQTYTNTDETVNSYGAAFLFRQKFLMGLILVQIILCLDWILMSQKTQISEPILIPLSTK